MCLVLLDKQVYCPFILVHISCVKLVLFVYTHLSVRFFEQTVYFFPCFEKMDVDEFQKLLALGKEIGLEGKDLQDFMRDERVAYREKQARDASECEKEFEFCQRQLEMDQVERESLRQHELELAKLKVENGTINQSDQSSLGKMQVQFKPAKLQFFDENKNSTLEISSIALSLMARCIHSP